ncbi:MAG: DUF4192 domain-containing protein [Candidatus Nanopelagicales bacterium]
MPNPTENTHPTALASSTGPGACAPTAAPPGHAPPRAVMTATRTEAIRLNCPSKLVAGSESLLGYRPEESLVAIFEGVPAAPGTLVLRVDLPGPAQLVPWIKQFMGVVLAYCPRKLSLVCWLSPPAAGVISDDLPTAEPLFRLTHALADRGIQVEAALSTNGEWIWCHGCPDPSCLPCGSELLTECAEEIWTHFGYPGGPRASRATLAAQLAPDAELSSRVAQELVAALPLKIPEQRVAAVEWLRGRWLGAPPEPATPAELSQMICFLFDRRVRDAIMVQVAGATDRTALDHALTDLLQIVRSAPAGALAPAATLLGLFAWLGGAAPGEAHQVGGGVLTSEALTKARSDDPDYLLAKLIDATVQSGVAPSEWLTAMSTLSEADCLTGRIPGTRSSGRDKKIRTRLRKSA